MPPPANATEVAIDNTLGVSLTAPIVHIGVNSRVLNSGLYLPDGTDLQAYDSDGETPLTTRLRAWGLNGGLHIKRRYNVTVEPQISAGAACVATINGTKYIVAISNSQTTDDPLSGRLVLLDPESGEIVDSWQSPGEDFLMSVAAYDVDGDGHDELIVGSRLIDSSAYLIDHDFETTLGIYDFGTTYVRTIDAAETDAGIRILAGGSGGTLVLLDADFGPIWELVGTTAICYPDCGITTRPHTLQNGILANADGTWAAYHVYGETIRRTSLTDGSEVWSTVDPLNIYAFGVAVGHFDGQEADADVIGVYAGESAQYGLVIRYDSTTGTEVWRRYIFAQCWDAECIDIDGDGYDEIIVGFGNRDIDAAPLLGWGGLLVLDRNGEIKQICGINGVKMTRTVDLGSGSEILCGTTDGALYRVGTGSSGGSIRVTLPNVTEGASTTIYLAPTGSSAIPTADEGICFTATDGTGTLPGYFTGRSGTWVLASDWLQSPARGDTGTAQIVSVDDSDTQDLDLEATWRCTNNGTGTAFDYLCGLYYRASTFGTGGHPLAYRIQIGLKGNMYLDRVPSGSGAQTYRLYNDGTDGNTWPGCSVGDVVRIRVLVAGNWHVLQTKINDGDWVTHYQLQDTNGSRIETAGAVAFAAFRGTQEYSAIKINGLPSAYSYMDESGGEGFIAPGLNGPQPVALLSELAGGRGSRRRSMSQTAAIIQLIRRANRR